ncbi:MAG: BamA/TamA family outer membrane protein [Bacteroidota bacterium]
MLPSLLSAQYQHYQLQLVALDKEADFLSKHVEIDPQFPDSLALRSSLNDLLGQLRAQAFIEASVDSLSFQDSIARAFVWVGQTYTWAQLDRGNLEDVFLDRIGYKERLYQDKPFHYSELQQLLDRLLNYAEENGFPFASVGLKDVQIVNGQVKARLHLNKGRLVLIEGVNVIGDVRISKTYLENYLGLKEGTLYSKTRIQKIRNRLKELPFLREKRSTTVTFKGDKAIVNLFLTKKKNSRWDFIFGILPGNDANNDRQLQLSFSFTGDLQNQFGKGEKLFVDFQQLRPENQELELRFAYPYILGLPFGADFNFQLFRRDTTLRDLNASIGIQYLLEGGNYLRAYYNNRSTALLTVQERDIINSRRLPPNIDVRNTSFGLEYNLQKLDYRFNPQKGWGLLLRGGAGLKRILKNNNILALEDEGDPAFDFESLYDSLNLSTFQYRLEAKLAYYWPLAVLGRSTIKLGAEGGLILSGEDIYQNEQYRLGGNRLLRGFDEESIFATRFSVFTLEYRVLLGLNSYAFLFGDFAYLEDLTADGSRYDSPYGFGGGITIDTKAGLLGVSLAWGARRTNPIDFRNTKVHLGFISYF